MLMNPYNIPFRRNEKHTSNECVISYMEFGISINTYLEFGICINTFEFEISIDTYLEFGISIN